MNNRLTISEISGLLVQPTGKDNAQIEQFLQEFVSVVKDKIFADRLVQIKGIGNFKIILVEKRESIDVNTKERIVIPEHYKLSFLPDKDMREVVNKPFSFFESIEIADGEGIPTLPEAELPDDDKEDDPDDDSILIDEKGLIETPVQHVAAQSVTNVIEEFPPLPVVPELIEEIPPIPVMPEPVDEIPHLPEPEATVQQLPIVEIEEDTNTYEFDNETNNNYLTEEKESIKDQLIDEKMAENNENGTNRSGYYKQPGNNNTVIVLLAAIVLVLLVAGAVLVIKNKDAIFGGGSGTTVATKTTDKADDALFALPPERDDSSIDEEWGEATDTPVDVAGTTHVKAPASSNKTKVSGTSAAAISSTPKGKAKAKATALRKKGPTTQQTSVTVRNGDRLNLYALKFYGNKVFWVYIYQANQSKLNNPDIIPVGITLTIPASSTYQIDSYNPASVRKAFALQTQILARFKGSNANPYGSNNYGSGQQGYDQYGGGQYGNSQLGQYGGGQYGNSQSGQYGGGQYGSSQSGQYGGGQYGGSYGSSTNGQYGGTGGQYGGSYDPYGTGGQYGNSLNDPTADPYDDPFGDILEYDDDYGNDLFDLNQSSPPAKSSGSAKKQSTTKRSSNSNIDDYGNSYNSGSQPKKKSSAGGSLGGYL